MTGVATDVLIVEDEPDIRSLIVHHLEREGYRCRTAASGGEALARVRASVPDLLVLDLMLPGMDGLEVCRRLRADPATAALPIIMLTAKADVVDRVVGLEVGADDYLGKPFSTKELVARARAVLRRARPGETGTRPLRVGLVSLDPSRHIVTVSGRAVEPPPVACSRASTCSIACGATRAPTRSSRARWTCTSAGCAPSSAPRSGASRPSRASVTGSRRTDAWYSAATR